MDPLDLAVLALRLSLVLVLYAFLAVVLRTAKQGLDRAASEPTHERFGDRERRGVASETRGPSIEPLRLRLLDGVEDEAVGAVFEVLDDATVGRSAQADLALRETSVSGEHARLRRQQGTWWVHDLTSTNGTFLNDVPVDGEVALRPGDVLRLGVVRLEVL